MARRRATLGSDHDDTLEVMAGGIKPYKLGGQWDKALAIAQEVLERRTFRDAVDADWDLSRRYGITGVPTFVAGRYGVVGAQPYEALEALVRKASPPADPTR